MRKIVLPAAMVASAATAFTLGALAFNSSNTPAGATPMPAPTVTETVKAEAAEKAADGTQDGTAKATTTKTTKTTKKAAAGSKGPFADAENDGKYLDDFGKSVMPHGVGVHVPDALLPFPGRDTTNTDPTTLPPGVVPADPDANYPDPDAGTDTSDDVVSGSPGESTTSAGDTGVPLDSSRPGPKPGGVVAVNPSGVVSINPGAVTGVLPSGVLPSGVLPAGVVASN
ncbi:hypothetical protein HOV11_gp48 [Streptomyces phage Vash]|uniref:Uncharacterized protein n=1 Tax=Streptomyces phage Vash TaxID=2510568 RepID=A0A411AYY7_9CAUD|nr:hypothetical protein HOV11_gp48 [Streptomyces phage Vash]QAX93304.1 hypothetical protein SEA_VASH_48 [Streptomyces phage Vash]